MIRPHDPIQPLPLLVLLPLLTRQPYAPDGPSEDVAVHADYKHDRHHLRGMLRQPGEQGLDHAGPPFSPLQLQGPAHHRG